MDTLRQLAEIPRHLFHYEPAHDLKTILYAQTFLAGAPLVATERAKESSLLDVLGRLERPPAYNRAATFALVCVARDRDERLLIGHDAFAGVFASFGIERRFLHLVATNRYGLHYGADGDAVSYYVGTGLYTLMWSFGASARRTRAVLLSRHAVDSPELSGLRRLVRAEAGRLHSPFLLAWVALVHLSNWMDRSTYMALAGIRQLEGVTGYGPYGAARLGGDAPAIEDLTQASKNIGSVLVDLANQTRHVAIGLALASHLAARPAKADAYAVEAFRTKCREELEAFCATVPSLQRSLGDSSAYVGYLQERVKSQSSVVYALMTHEDARINIRLAQASKDLAEAAKKDSSSMKTIAVMTMLFLPGTYFASLWAVPTLQWDQAGVIQDNFWVYWAFTLPCTTAVFAVWLGLHRWKSVLRLLGRWRRTTGGGGNSSTVPAYQPSPSQDSPPPPPMPMPKFQGSAPPIAEFVPLPSWGPRPSPPPVPGAYDRQAYGERPGESDIRD